MRLSCIAPMAAKRYVPPVSATSNGRGFDIPHRQHRVCYNCFIVVIVALKCVVFELWHGTDRWTAAMLSAYCPSSVDNTGSIVSSHRLSMHFWARSCISTATAVCASGVATIRVSRVSPIGERNEAAGREKWYPSTLEWNLGRNCARLRKKS